MNRRAPGKSRSALSRRAKKFRLSRCERCSQTSGLHVHHKDKDWTNNDIGNLETLCQKCHLQEHWSEWRIIRGGKTECRICGIAPGRGAYKYYCGNHYAMIFKRGRIEPFKRRAKSPACIICGGRYFAADLCQSHYHRKRKYGDPLGLPNWEEIKKKMVRRPLTKKPCRVCGAPWIKGKSKKDLCSVHREPKKKRIRKPRITKKYCSLCPRPLLARGYCTAHYKRFKLYGDARGGLWEMDSCRSDNQRVPLNKVVNKGT